MVTDTNDQSGLELVIISIAFFSAYVLLMAIMAFLKIFWLPYVIGAVIIGLSWKAVYR